MIIIIDYGMGNLRSVQKAFERINIVAKITNDKNEIINAEKLILPGVGHFKKGMENLTSLGLFDVLNFAVIEKQIPILGICLGMQLFTEFSEEGNMKGFGWVKAETKKFNFKIDKLKIPHMGWNNLIIQKQNCLINYEQTNNLFYFVHSYYIKCYELSDVLSYSNYGHSFVSSFQKANIFGCQFHPEKSHSSGLEILKNFIKI